MTEHRHAKIVRELVRPRLSFGRGAEIGVWSGATSTLLLGSLPGLKLLFAIDPYLAHKDYLDQAHDSLTECPQAYLNAKYQKTWTQLTHRFGDRVAMLRHTSDRVVELGLIADRSLDFVFIDGCHAPPYAERDCVNYHAKIRPGGVLCWHDWGRVICAVRRAMATLGIDERRIEGPRHQVGWVHL